jgi:glutathione peroxidase
LTASQYSGLESIYNKYKDKGFKVLAFPANNFANQEPGTAAEIRAFCAAKNVTFDLFAKVSVKGSDQCPLYRFLTTYPDKAVAGDVTWNFQKYLVGRNGKVIAKFGPRVKPEGAEVVSAVEKALAARPEG